MEDRMIKNFLCECDCKVAIKDTIAEHNIPIEDYKEILTDIKEWIEFLIED
jgi:hypothetical protein